MNLYAKVKMVAEFSENSEIVFVRFPTVPTTNFALILEH